MGNTASGKQRRNSIECDFGQNSINIGGKRRSHYQQDGEQIFTNTGNKYQIEAVAEQYKDIKINEPLNLFANNNTSPENDDNSTPVMVPTVFKWEGGGKQVYISGTFNGWKSKIPMVKSNHNFYTIVDLPLGEHQYKFIVDGQWKLDQKQPINKTVAGVENNSIEVKSSDVDVLDALTYMDSMPTGGCETPPGEYNKEIPETPADAITMMNNANVNDSLSSNNNNSATAGQKNTSNNNQKAPSGLDLKKLLTPPALPPQLLQVILNKDTHIQCDPNLLPQPNHVMVNHMYALSIKDGVIVLSAITRYRQKFVSTVLYKPI